LENNINKIMQSYTKILTTGGLATMVLVLWLASVKGWGLSNLSDPQTLQDRAINNCPEYQKDRFGNCPQNTHRRRLGGRNFYGGGGK
jgi:hypothetical protein